MSGNHSGTILSTLSLSIGVVLGALTFGELKAPVVVEVVTIDTVDCRGDRLLEMVEDLAIGFTSEEVVDIASAIRTASVMTGLPEELISAKIMVESTFIKGQVSETGAQNLAQVIPSTGREVMGWVSPLPYDGENVAQNIIAGALYLGYMYSVYGDLEQALVAYNQGPGFVNATGVSSSHYSRKVVRWARVIRKRINGA